MELIHWPLDGHKGWKTKGHNYNSAQDKMISYVSDNV